MGHTRIFAHRGSSKAAPENTMAAFQKALEEKAEGLEIDVHLTRDGEMVVLHDEWVDRTTDGSGWVRDFALEELKRLDNGRWFSSRFEGQRIPTLDEVLEWILDTGLHLNIELKNNRVPYPGMEEEVIRLVERFAMEERVIISSFHHDSLMHVRKFRPKWRIGLLYDSAMSEPWLYAKRMGADAIHPHYSVVDDEAVRLCHDHGIHVRPYTVDDPALMERFLMLQVDAIITNVPDRLKRLRDAKDQLLAQTE